MSEIAMRGVRKSFAKTEVIHGVDLEVAAGEFVVLLGPSGCGKSTLLRLVAGLEALTAGEIRIGGRVVNQLEPRERGCAMVFQNYALYPHMTVAENIGYALKVAGMGRAERSAKVRGVAEILGLVEFLDRKPAQLSGGQRQRVAMGRAMIREPSVFLYDEPLSNLDARLRVAMRVEIRKLHQRLGRTTLFVTHDQVEAMTLADRVVVMNKGRIDQVGSPREVYVRPASTYVAGFIGSPGMNLLPGTVDPAAGVIHLRDGQALAYDRRRWADVGAGAVTVGFRAEQARLGETRGSLAMAFEFGEELGASRLLHATLGGEIVAVVTAEERRIAVGESLRVSVAPVDVHLYDATTGVRLAETGIDGSAVAEPVADRVYA